MTSLSLKAAAALAVAMLAIAPAPLMAADEKPKAAAKKPNFSEKRITDFVAAAKDVFAIRRKYAPQFESAANTAEKKKIVQTASGEMKQAIQNRGLTVDQYNAVLVAAKDDQALAERIGKMMSKGAAGKDG